MKDTNIEVKTMQNYFANINQKAFHANTEISYKCVRTNHPVENQKLSTIGHLFLHDLIDLGHQQDALFPVLQCSCTIMMEKNLASLKACLMT